MSYFLNVVREQLAVVRSVGGWKGAFFRLLREGNVRVGTLVGTDAYGNKYYENNTYFMGRNRFVEFPYVDRLTFDASQVPSDWHRWLHHITDDSPTKVPPPERKFAQPRWVNTTGTTKEYVPYNTTLPKIEAWEPPKK